MKNLRKRDTSLQMHPRKVLKSLLRVQIRNVQLTASLPFPKSQSGFNETVDSDGVKHFLITPNRYHLYSSFACPFAHRALLVRALKGLTKAIPSSDLWVNERNEYIFSDQPGEGSPDFVNRKTTLMEVYKKSSGSFKGRATVPALFDRNLNRIINNESAEIMRIFNDKFNKLAEYPDRDFYPESLQKDIDQVNEWVHNDITMGVYLTGNSRNQKSYERNVMRVFDALDKVEDILENQRYLCGDRLTEADLRLWPSLLRFDPIYNILYLCNLRRISDYKNLSGYTRDIFQIPGVEETVNMDHAKKIYLKYQKNNNPKGIISIGPIIDLHLPHGRDHLQRRPL